MPAWNQLVSLAAVAPVVIGSTALAGFTVTQGDSAPTYDVTLNFDEPGGPTGLVAQDAWLDSHGVLINSGAGDPAVGDNSGFYPWINDGNSMFCNFGLFFTSTQDLTAFSVQLWDPSGPPSPFGGGLVVALFNDGQKLDFVGGFTPAWGGIGESWFNIVATDGMVFDEVRMLGFGFGPTTFVDNLSWTPVPAPGAFAVLGLAGLLNRRRRAA